MIYLFPFRFWPNGVLKTLERKQNSKSGPIISFEKRKARAIEFRTVGSAACDFILESVPLNKNSWNHIERMLS